MTNKQTKSRTAIYPGTFDPITNGHSDIIERAAKLFDHVIVAIAASSAKRTVFTADERVSLAETVLAHRDNVEVACFSGLMTAFARERKAGVIIRGLRAVSDFEYEFQLSSMNRRLYAEAETVFLTPPDQLNYVSSSLIREIASLDGDVTPFVHKAVSAALKKKFQPSS